MKHEQECFIRRKTRGDSRVFISDKCECFKWLKKLPSYEFIGEVILKKLTLSKPRFFITYKTTDTEVISLIPLSFPHELSKSFYCFSYNLVFVCLQTLLKTAGAQMKPTVFLLTDTQIKEESFLEDIDSLLNTGEVPNLFAVDEKAELVEVSSYDLELL